MTLPELSVKRPVFVTCLFLVILALGWLARSRLGTSLYPDVSFPVVNVVIPFPGAGPEEIESQVTRPIETAMNSLSGIKQSRSISLDGAAVVTAVFTMDTDVRFAEQRVTQLLARMRGELPHDILDPTVRTIDPSDTPVATLSLSANVAEAELFDLADRDVRPLLEQVPQVGLVEIAGARKREIEVELDPRKLKSREMSASEVTGRLSAAGLNIPAGELHDVSRETLVRTVAQFDSLDAIRATPVRFVGNENVINLGEIATVNDGLEEEKSRVYVNGVRSLSFKIFRRSGANTVDVSDRVTRAIADVNSRMAAKVPGFKLTMVRDGAKAVREAVDDANIAVLVGIFLTVSVVFFFLGGLRSTVITGLALPNSLLGAFMLMWVAGFSVNITTLAALGLAVGLLIDDAIVVRENIFRRIEEGESPHDAAIQGTRQVALAVVATTLTVLSVFAPVSFMGGLIGQFFKEFGLTICFAMLISLLDSLTVAPMLSAYFAHPVTDKKKSTKISDYVRDKYLALLDHTLRHPFRALLIAAVIFGLSLVVLMLIPKTFLPAQQSGEFSVTLDRPAGISLDEMDRAARLADAKIRAQSAVERTVLTLGGENGEKNHAEILVQLKSSKDRTLSTDQAKDAIRRELTAAEPDTSFRVEDLLDVGGGAGSPFVVDLTGSDLTQLKDVSATLVDKLRHNGDLKDVDRSYRPGAREVRWVIDPKLAQEYGVSSAEVGQELRTLVSGATPAHFHTGDREYGIRVHLRSDADNLRAALPSLLVPNLNHRLLPLSLIAHEKETESPARIERQDGHRIVEITANTNPQGHGLAAALTETRRLFSSGEVKLPEGMGFEFAGQTKDFQELLGGVILAALLSVGAMYVVLASLYDSFFVPLAIMLVLPLAICGAFYALGVTGSTLDIYSMIGCILLMGVAAKNSILLVDHIHQGVLEGVELREAIREAGRERLRPILMTSFALVAGMLPMAIPFQESAKARAPMAIAVIGGVVTSTLLTLVVVPAAYEYILAFQNWVLRKLRFEGRPVDAGENKGN